MQKRRQRYPHLEAPQHVSKSRQYANVREHDSKGLMTYVDALVRERVEHLERLVLVFRLQALRVETRRDDRFDQRIEE